MVVAIIQARLGSTRLPRKVARLISGEPMLAQVIGRTQRIPGISEVVVATTTTKVDQWVVDESHRCGVRAFQGPVDDVLGRYEGVVGLLDLKNQDHIVRITADCPLLDPGVSDQVIQLALTQRVDYAANLRDWPDGLDTEVFTRRALRDAYHMATGPEDREHVTPWMRRNLLCVELPHDPPLRHIKFSVDTEEELEYTQELYAGGGGELGWEALLRLLPALVCPKCAVGYPHRTHPLGTIMQKTPEQPMVTAWDLHAKESGLGLLDPDPECLAPELSRRRASETPSETGVAPAPDASAPRNPSAAPANPGGHGDR